MTKENYVYIMTNKSRTRYKGLTAKDNLRDLVHAESTSSIHAAVERKKQIKGWSRAKKNALINSMNPDWKDLIDKTYQVRTIEIPKRSINRRFDRTKSNCYVH